MNETSASESPILGVFVASFSIVMPLLYRTNPVDWHPVLKFFHLF
jgi:hypothetical protein